jgi:hypothetical protein
VKNSLIFLPVVIQIALTLLLYIYLAVTKSRAAKLGQVNEERRALHDDAWPDNVLQINNCIRNQFEVPVLFYVLVVVSWLTGSINVYVHLLAWVFVLTRILHASVHVGSNFVPLRRGIFTAGCVLLMIMTIFLAYSILSLQNA